MRLLVSGACSSCGLILHQIVRDGGGGTPLSDSTFEVCFLLSCGNVVFMYFIPRYEEHSRVCECVQVCVRLCECMFACVCMHMFVCFVHYWYMLITSLSRECQFLPLVIPV